MPYKNFSLEENSFRVLKAGYRSSAAEISDLVEDAELDGIVEEELLQQARQALITPRSRLELELAWLPELSQTQIIKVYDLLKSTDASTILREVDHFPDLAKANIAAHLCSHGQATTQAVHAMARSWDEIDHNQIRAFIDEQRRSSGFPKIETRHLQAVLNDLRLRHATAAANWVWTLPTPGTTMNNFVEKELNTNQDGTFLRQFVNMYDKGSEPPLAVIAESIKKSVSLAKDLPADMRPIIEQINNSLARWDSINQPVQVYCQSCGQEEGRSKKVYEEIRELCLDLANQHNRFDEALQLSTALLRTFPELESVAESLKGDILALESLVEQKKISDQLDPLVEACEAAKNNSASFSKAIKSNGLSVGSNKCLNDVTRSFHIARNGLPDLGVAFLVVLDLAISINNDSNDPQTAFILVNELINHGKNNGPELVMERLREERSILHKNWKMKELNFQSGNFTSMQKIIDELLVYANAADRRDFERLKRKIAGKLFAKRIKIIVLTGILVLICLFAVSEQISSTGKQVVYRPAANSEPPFAPAIVSDISVLYQEDRPPIGRGLSLNMTQVRYCVFQAARLEYIRLRTLSNFQVDRFNVLIDDYNQRCSDYSYVSGTLQSVQVEASRRSIEFQADARKMVTSW